MNKILFFALISILGVIYFVIGALVSKKIKSTQDYFLAGRNLSFFPLVVSLIGTQLGGGFIIGTSREAYAHGYYGLIYIGGVCLGLLLLGSGIASRLRLSGVETTAQLFELRYQSVFLKKYASLCSILSLGGIFAAQILASKALMVSLNTYSPGWFSLFWVLVITYAMVGGLTAIVDNDVFQLSFIITIFTSLFLFDIFSSPADALTVFFKAATMSNTQLTSVAGALTIFLMPALYALIEQDLAQIFFAAQTARLAVSAALIASAFLTFFAFVPLFFGMKAKFLNIGLAGCANPLMSYFDTRYSGYSAALVTYAILAAIISSANALLCGISSNLVQDFKLTSFDEKHALAISKSATFFVGIAGLAISFYFTDLIGLLCDSYAIPVTSLFISLLVAYYTNGPLSPIAAYLSAFTGFSSFFIFMLTKPILSTPAVDALLFSILGYAIGLLLDFLLFRKKA